MGATDAELLDVLRITRPSALPPATADRVRPEEVALASLDYELSAGFKGWPDLAYHRAKQAILSAIWPAVRDFFSPGPPPRPARPTLQVHVYDNKFADFPCKQLRGQLDLVSLRPAPAGTVGEPATRVVYDVPRAYANTLERLAGREQRRAAVAAAAAQETRDADGIECGGAVGPAADLA